MMWAMVLVAVADGEGTGFKNRGDAEHAEIGTTEHTESTETTLRNDENSGCPGFGSPPRGL